MTAADYNGIAAVLAGLAATITALDRLFASARGRKKTLDAIEVVRQDVNGKAHELNDAISGKALAEGQLQEAQRKRDEIRG